MDGGGALKEGEEGTEEGGRWGRWVAEQGRAAHYIYIYKEEDKVIRCDMDVCWIGFGYHILVFSYGKTYMWFVLENRKGGKGGFEYECEEKW